MVHLMLQLFEYVLLLSRQCLFADLNLLHSVNLARLDDAPLILLAVGEVTVAHPFPELAENCTVLGNEFFVK